MLALLFLLPDRLPPDVLLVSMWAIVGDHYLIDRDLLGGGQILQGGLVDVLEQGSHLLEPDITSTSKNKI